MISLLSINLTTLLTVPLTNLLHSPSDAVLQMHDIPSISLAPYWMFWLSKMHLVQSSHLPIHGTNITFKIISLFLFFSSFYITFFHSFQSITHVNAIVVAPKYSSHKQLRPVYLMLKATKNLCRKFLCPICEYQKSLYGHSPFMIGSIYLFIFLQKSIKTIFSRA